MPIPTDHPQRIELNDEVHARPPEALVAPLRLTFLALLTSVDTREQEWQHICKLLEHYGAPTPPAGASHVSADLGAFRLKWERHTEFSRYTFIDAGAGDDPFAEPPLAAVPQSWIADLPGATVVAAHAALVAGGDAAPDLEKLSARLFAGNALIGSKVSGGAGLAISDLRIREDGFSRFYVMDRGMTPRQGGRVMQRLLEIDTYRIMALLALPVARQLVPQLVENERELADITGALANATVEDEAQLLERLIRLEAEIENRESQHTYRFGASAAYYELVQRRIGELREERIQGLQTLREFTERRLAPAMTTCQSVATRQRALSARVARATQLLSTRVDITRERQNQALLESMNRRAKLQLRLQQTVEGLSVAAVTYYVVGLVGYAAKGLTSAGIAVNTELAMAIAIPVVALSAALAVRKIRRAVAHGD